MVELDNSSSPGRNLTVSATVVSAAAVNEVSVSATAVSQLSSMRIWAWFRLFPINLRQSRFGCFFHCFYCFINFGL